MLGYAVATPVNARQRTEEDLMLGDWNCNICGLETSDVMRMV
jgi:hypothetical protein